MPRTDLNPTHLFFCPQGQPRNTLKVEWMREMDMDLARRRVRLAVNRSTLFALKKILLEVPLATEVGQ